MSRRLTTGAFIILAGMLAGWLARAGLGPLEDRVTAAKYHLRGERIPDSSIVVVYIDNDAVANLGWPVRRNFHALMIKALSDLRARAIGIDIQFGASDAGFPEYDRLLASTAASAGNVVTASYLGSRIHFPFPALRNAAAGVGHDNLGDGAEIPVFVQAGPDTLPAFGLEVTRVAAGAPAGAVERTPGHVNIVAHDRTIDIPVDSRGVAGVLVPLDQSAFRSYPFLEVLKAYDAANAGRPPSIPLSRFRNAIVLVGVIAEGRSPVVATVLHERFPSLLLQAAFVDNALHGRFVHQASTPVVMLLCLVTALLTVLGVLVLRPRPGRFLVWCIPVAAFIGSTAAFAWWSYLLPFMPLVAAWIVAGVPAFLLEHRRTQAKVDTLQTEKETISEQLRDREAKVAMLERELVDAAGRRTADRTHELLEEIRKYKAEIRSLGAKVSDMESYAGPDGDARPEPREFEGMVYDGGGRMAPVIDFVAKIAASDAPVLVLGESGTGKELIARALHHRGARQGRPFIAVNCGALSENLLETELFGHEKGAFTGAVKEKAGRFELADGGTVFLDEIGEVSENFQIKLLRVLQEGEFERVGGTRTFRVNLRIIAATNRDLRGEVRNGRFREDLFYRLNVLTVEVPPLRERPEDIPLLVARFLKRSESGTLQVSRNVMDAFSVWTWPGNVRELESAVTRAVLLARADGRTMITMKDITAEIAAAYHGSAALEDQILQAIREKGFSRSSVTETAEELGGLNRGTVAEYLRGEFLKAFVEHGFDADETVKYLALSESADVGERVRKRLQEYLENIGEGIDRSQPWDASRPILKSKMKNLPQRYHQYLEQVAEGRFRNRWQLDGE